MPQNSVKHAPSVDGSDITGTFQLPINAPNLAKQASTKKGLNLIQ
jgi:hypothetical protein